MKPIESTQEQYEAELKARHVHVGCITLNNGGYVYFRRPTPEEHATFQSLFQEEGSRVMAFSRYVRGCYVGAWPDPQATLDEILTQEGPGALAGAFGACVNRLAGSQDRPTRML